MFMSVYLKRSQLTVSEFSARLPLIKSGQRNYGTLKQLETVTPEASVKPATKVGLLGTLNKATAFAQDLLTFSGRDDAAGWDNA